MAQIIFVFSLELVGEFMINTVCSLTGAYSELTCAKCQMKGTFSFSENKGGHQIAVSSLLVNLDLGALFAIVCFFLFCLTTTRPSRTRSRSK